MSDILIWFCGFAAGLWIGSMIEEHFGKKEYISDMARYKDVEGYRKLFDEEYKKTRKLISEGKTYLDNLAEGFSEADRVIDCLPTDDVAPKSEVAIKICSEINGEIADALASNFRVIRDALEYDELYYTAYGKISALRGILDFICELKKEYTED